MPLPPSPLPGKLCAVIDGTGVPMTSRETAGRDGKGEDGRARTREARLAVFFTRDGLDKDGYPVRGRDSSSVIAAFEPAAVFGELVKAEGIRRGADHVRQLTILGDGAAWIWGIATARFPRSHPGRRPVPRPRAPARPRPHVRDASRLRRAAPFDAGHRCSWAPQPRTGDLGLHAAARKVAAGDLLGARRVAVAAPPIPGTVRRVTAEMDVSYIWNEAPVPEGLEIAKVYGFLICPDTARVLVQECEGSFNLPGGSPEPVDADLSATLAREALEESQVVVSRTAYLGYQEVRRPGWAPYAQVRMAGLIEGFRSRCPDADSGRLLRRLMCPLADVPAVLGWGEIMEAQAALAARTVQLLWRIPAGTPRPAGYAD